MFGVLFKRVLINQTFQNFCNSQKKWPKTVSLKIFLNLFIVIHNIQNKLRLFYYAFTGGSTSIAITLFGSAKPLQSTTDRKKSEFDLMREADLFYDR